MLRRVALVRTDVSEELSASFIRGTRIGELGTALAVTSNRRTVRRNTKRILVTLMKEALSSSETSILQEPNGVTFKKTPFFVVTAVKTSNLTSVCVSRRHLFSIGHSPVSRLSRQCGILNILQPYRPPWPVTGIAFFFFYFFYRPLPFTLFLQYIHICNVYLRGFRPVLSPHSSSFSCR
jgi:hypothetical protein